MRVLLVSANREEINMRSLPLGLACVAAATREAGHEVTLIDLMNHRDPLRSLQEFVAESQPEVIGVSVRNIDDQNAQSPRFLLDQAKEVVALCRATSKAPIVLGGAGYSIFPQSALAYLGAEMGIRGEGESAFPALLNRLEGGAELDGLPRLHLPGRESQVTTAFPTKLDAFPLPDAGLLAQSEAKDAGLWLPVQTRRGCPMECSYCSTASIEGHLLRRRSPDMVAQALRKWSRAGFENFYFVDNIFNLPPSYARELCARMAAADLHIRWRAIVYPTAVDEGLVRAMAMAGCREVSLGFESGSPSVLRSMNKRFGLQDVRRISEILGDHGIKRMGFLLLGGPAETRQTVEESLAFADSLGVEEMKVSAGIRIYPNTPLARIAVMEGRISKMDDLLFPRFYLAEGLDEWLIETLNGWISQRPNWRI
jgi:radical SAM superfamily enzyme YgiQ (UPF0313 family)